MDGPLWVPEHEVINEEIGQDEQAPASMSTSGTSMLWPTGLMGGTSFSKFCLFSELCLSLLSAPA